MPYAMEPLSCEPAHIKRMSERRIVSQHENNYGGAVRRLNHAPGRKAAVVADDVQNNRCKIIARRGYDGRPAL